MAAELPALAGGASRVIHLDFHTGLGRWKTHQLLVDASPGAPRTKRLIGIFGAERISAGRPSIGLPDRAGIYRTRGTWDRWCSQRFSHIAYDYACAEFGTYGPLAIIAALRAENRAWRHVPLAERHRYERVWRRVCEVFCPADAGWREQALADGVAICELARERLP